MTARQLAESYDGRIVIKRMKATGTDFIVLFLAIAVVGALWNPRETSTILEVCLGISFAYYLVMETAFGRTVGKFAHGIAVVSEEGRRPEFASVLIRTLTRVIEVNPILFGAAPAGLVANFSKSHRRLGDMLASTFVVLAADLPRITSSPFMGSA